MNEGIRKAIQDGLQTVQTAKDKKQAEQEKKAADQTWFDQLVPNTIVPLFEDWVRISAEHFAATFEIYGDGTNDGHHYMVGVSSFDLPVHNRGDDDSPTSYFSVSIDRHGTALDVNTRVQGHDHALAPIPMRSQASLVQARLDEWVTRFTVACESNKRR